ncbi:MAG: RNA-binding protein [Pseudochelatococcus sp.]|uniref:RNA-binding protein n=1 Tax=Pseudochelatococcus sp. TaxID=2020869 RepID=UPI003D9213D7
MPRSERHDPAGEDSRQEDSRREDSRTCALSRRPMAKEAMIRFVAAPDRTVVPDIRARLPGRGVWIEATREAVAAAARGKTFARGLKAGVKVSATLADDVEALLRRDALQALALANKAGAVVTGFGKVEALAAAEGKAVIAALIHAREAAPDGRRKLAQALRRGHNERSDAVPVIDCFEGSHLDLALGRTHVIHAALVAGSGSDGFMTRWHRLARYSTTGFSTPPSEASAAAETGSEEPERGGKPDDEAIMGQE